jgi:hypothetical protein
MCQTLREEFISVRTMATELLPAPLIKVVNPFPGPIAGADFNNDGKIDLATGQSLSIDLHLGTGTGDFQTPVSFVLDKSPYDIITGDFNKDGNIDLAACTEYNSEGMSVLLGNGDGTFQPAQNYDGAYSPDLRNESGITSGDVDGDDDIDLIVGNAASNDVSIYLNNGGGSFTFKMRYGMYYSTTSPFYADFTGDGKNDIIAAVSVPPSGFQGAITLIKGKILNLQMEAYKPTSASQIVSKDTRSGNGILIKNNPISNYIDVEFKEIPVGKITFQLTDLTGCVVASSAPMDVLQSVVRFDPGIAVLPDGAYILSAVAEGRKYTATVIK